MNDASCMIATERITKMENAQLVVLLSIFSSTTTIIFSSIFKQWAGKTIPGQRPSAGRDRLHFFFFSLNCGTGHQS